MITHLMLLKPKPDLTASNQRALVLALERAAQQISSIRAVRIGRRVTHGAAYEQGMPDTADFVAALEFDDVPGLQTYLQHPAHAELGALFGRSLSSACVYDFETGGLEMLQSLV